MVTLPLYGGFELGTAAMQFVEKAPWIERFNVNYHLGVDGISLWLVLLTAFINLVVAIAGGIYLFLFSGHLVGRGEEEREPESLGDALADAQDFRQPGLAGGLIGSAEPFAERFDRWW
jgi:hypothetical protein